MATEDPHGVIALSGEGTVDQLLRRAVREIETLGFDVLGVVDYSGDAHEAGISMPETKLVLFGSPEAAARLVFGHPHMAFDLPLTLLISESDDGHVSVSYQEPGLVAQRHGLTDNEADDLRVVETIARAMRSAP